MQTKTRSQNKRKKVKRENWKIKCFSKQQLSIKDYKHIYIFCRARFGSHVCISSTITYRKSKMISLKLKCKRSRNVFFSAQKKWMEKNVISINSRYTVWPRCALVWLPPVGSYILCLVHFAHLKLNYRVMTTKLAKPLSTYSGYMVAALICNQMFSKIQFFSVVFRLHFTDSLASFCDGLFTFQTRKNHCNVITSSHPLSLSMLFLLFMFLGEFDGVSSLKVILKEQTHQRKKIASGKRNCASVGYPISASN